MLNNAEKNAQAKNSGTKTKENWTKKECYAQCSNEREKEIGTKKINEVPRYFIVIASTLHIESQTSNKCFFQST